MFSSVQADWGLVVQHLLTSCRIHLGRYACASERLNYCFASEGETAPLRLPHLAGPAPSPSQKLYERVASLCLPRSAFGFHSSPLQVLLKLTRHMQRQGHRRIEHRQSLPPQRQSLRLNCCWHGQPTFVHVDLPQNRFGRFAMSGDAANGHVPGADLHADGQQRSIHVGNEVVAKGMKSQALLGDAFRLDVGRKLP